VARSIGAKQNSASAAEHASIASDRFNNFGDFPDEGSSDTEEREAIGHLPFRWAFQPASN
jgi:hypothetical protein